MTKPLSDELTEALLLPISDSRHIPLALGEVNLQPTPEQLADIVPLIEFYDTPWWRRVFFGLFKR